MTARLPRQRFDRAVIAFRSFSPAPQRAPLNASFPVSQSASLNSSFPAPQSGHTKSSGMSSHLVPGAIPPSGYPSSSLYSQPQRSQTFFIVSVLLILIPLKKRHSHCSAASVCESIPWTLKPVTMNSDASWQVSFPPAYCSFSKSLAGCLHSGQMKSSGRSSPS